MVDQARLPNADMPAVSTTDLCVGYFGKPILNGINIDVFKGEVFGILGPNGVGKSTLLKCLTGLLPPMQGQVRAFGLEPQHDTVAYRRQFGAMLSPENLPRYLTGDQFLNLIARLRNVDLQQDLVEDLKKRFEVGTWLSKPIGTYSMGTQVKVAIISALIGSPQILFFDEPLNGLDPVVSLEFRKLVSELRTQNHCIFVTTHMLDFAARNCDRAILLMNGEVKISWDRTQMSLFRNNVDVFETMVVKEIRAQADL